MSPTTARGNPIATVCAAHPWSTSEDKGIGEFTATHAWDFYTTLNSGSALKNTTSWWQIPSCLSSPWVETWQLRPHSAVRICHAVDSFVVPIYLHCIANLVLFHTCYSSANLQFILSSVSWTTSMEGYISCLIRSALSVTPKQHCLIKKLPEYTFLQMNQSSTKTSLLSTWILSPWQRIYLQ